MAGPDIPTIERRIGIDAPVRPADQRLIEAAGGLFARHGIRAVGLPAILRRAGVTWETFRRHFADKEALVLAMLAQRDRTLAESFGREVRALGGDDPRAQILAVFDVLDRRLACADHRGCLFLAACAEYPLAEHPIHRAAAAHYRAVRDQFATLAAAAGSREPEGLASALVLLLQGAASQRLILGDLHAAAPARRAAELLLD